MPDEQEELKNESQTEKTSQPGKLSRAFLTLLILGVTVTTVVFAYLREGQFFSDLLLRDEWTSRLIGNLHPILMLLPVGLVLLVTLVEVLGWFSFGKWRPVTVFALFLIVITSVLASVSGLFLMKLEGNTGSDWTQYMWYGVGATVAFGLSFLCKIWGENGNGRGFIYAVLLLGGAAAIGYGGYRFGQKVHSYSLIPTQELETPFGNKKVRESISASLGEMKAASVKLEEGLIAKDGKIAELSSAQQATEKRVLDEQKKLATAQASIGQLKQSSLQAEQKASASEKKLAEIQKQVAEAQKKTAGAQQAMKDLQQKSTEMQKKLQAAGQEKQKLQGEVTGLKNQIETLKKKVKQAAKKQVKTPKPQDPPKAEKKAEEKVEKPEEAAE